VNLLRSVFNTEVVRLYTTAILVHIYTWSLSFEIGLFLFEIHLFGCEIGSTLFEIWNRSFFI